MWSKAETQGLGGVVRLLPAERLMLIFIAVVGLLAVALALALERQVNWPPFLGGYAATLALAAIGGYVRQTKSAPRIGLALVGAGIFAGFTAVSSIFIFALFPLANPLIDPLLLRMDAALGYHWPGLIAWLADYPAFAHALGYVYHSSLVQILLTIVLLAALSRDLDLHRFLLVGIVTLILAVAIWWVVPSIGPSAFQTIPEPHRLATGLYYSPAYGEYLRTLVEVGPNRISPEVVTGVVAFPSYHMIMALMVVWFTRGTMAFLPAALVNTAMVPATLSHGGHHLVDLIGGLAVFALGVWIATRLIRPGPQP
ncbi:MAG: phosphatase PAP2 family protein [Tabrizicola sp.]|uniref:phosphatase PAP2 family protein n=1 Tax=Tabrizicola sp. TaxID=2005166 RepID=UPI002733C58D|nr:phosphatase PAP2 family protein [Tabrizicola sp.]MDP3262049.1 phosphatase PAP2 family protein [Tabrizicola sp.]